MSDERSDAPLADESRPGAVPNDMPVADVDPAGSLAGGTPPEGADEPATAQGGPTGLPDSGSPEETPLGPEDESPEGEGESRRGPEHMPGMPTEGEPPSGG